MVNYWACEKDVVDRNLYDSLGFKLDAKRDIKTTTKDDGSTVERLSFVGFISNNNDDLFAVLPYNYCVTDIESDCQKVFDCIKRFSQRRPNAFLGDINSDEFVSNYPFASFFEIYDYYQKYGLFFEEEHQFRINSGGKVAWKYTIAKSSKYIVGNDVFLHPLYYNKKFLFSNFVTDCMVFAIDYTVEKFGMFLNVDGTNRDIPDLNIENNQDIIIEKLLQVKQSLFNDVKIRLIDNLISYFEKLEIGGNYYLKHYKFSSIWQEMVNQYLISHYSDIGLDRKMVLDKKHSKNIAFAETVFHVNAAKPDSYIKIDHYGTDGKKQLLFDSKYYDEDPSGTDYKQFSYYIMMEEISITDRSPSLYAETYASLILPSDSRRTSEHFRFDPRFTKRNRSVVVMEEYIDIRDVIDNYLKI